jgi:aminotransferase
LPQGFYRDLSSDYLAKRELLCQTLREIGLTPFVPQGSYYVLADASTLPGNNSKQRAMALLEQTGVAAVPGEAFYHHENGRNPGSSLLRFCFAKTETDLAEACRRLHRLKLAAVSARS